MYGTSLSFTVTEFEDHADGHHHYQREIKSKTDQRVGKILRSAKSNLKRLMEDIKEEQLGGGCNQEKILG
jgi:hypothetical protein